MSISLATFIRCSQLAVILLLAANLAIGQPTNALRFEAITLENGLTQGFVGAILQDKRGLMWFATRDGLNKYDGSTITSYTHDPDDSTSIGSNYLESLFEDAQGRLWIGTRDNGLDLFDREHNKFYHIRHTDASSIRSNQISKITEDKTGALWLQTGKGLDRVRILNNKNPLLADNPLAKLTLQITHIDISNAYNRVRDKLGCERVFIDSQGRVLVTTNENIWEVLFLASTNQYTVEKRYSFRSKDTILVADLLEDSVQHRLYLNTGRIIQFANYDFTAERVLVNNSFFPWILDGLNRLWVCDKKKLLQLHLSSGALTQITVHNPLHQSAFDISYCFYVDRSGVLWIGTGGYGILKYDPSKELFHQALPGQSLYQLLNLSADQLITDKFQLLTLKKGQPAVVAEPPYGQLLRGKVRNINSFANDSKGNLWLGTRDDLIQFSLNDNTLHQYALPLGTTKGDLYPIFADTHNNIWMGYDEYLLSFSPADNTFQTYPYPVKSFNYQNNVLQSVYEDNGVLWLGLTNGLAKFSLSQKRFLHHYAYKQGDSTSLSYNFIYSLCNDPRLPQHYLWVGTNGGGLNRFDKHSGTFRRFNIKHGLPNNVVYGIVPDYRGHVWVSTNRGISDFDPSTGQFNNYTASDGLQSNEFNRFSYTKTRGGLLVFGGVNGLSYFDPRTINELPPPRVVFTQFRLFNKAVSNLEPGSPLQNDIGYTDAIKLRYDQNVLTFRFAAMDYRRSGSIQYRYKLEGFQSNWIYAGTSQEATFTNLDPGDYRFVVQASFDPGRWGRPVTAIRLAISPPWWQTRWAYGFYLLLGLGLVSAYLQYRRNRAALQQEVALKEQEARLTKENADWQTRFFTNITHEFRTSLTLIVGPLERLMAPSTKLSRESLDQQYGVMYRNAQRLLRLINQLLDIAKLEADQLTLDESQGKLPVFVAGLVDSFRPRAEKKGLQLNYEASGLTADYCFDAHKLETIGYNLLANAVKFTPPGGQIQVQLSEASLPDGGPGFQLQVSDTGVGIPPEQLPRIFDRFYQGANTDASTGRGTGIGLFLVAEFTRLLGGSVTAQSQLGEGTTFQVTLHLRQASGLEPLVDTVAVEALADSQSTPQGVQAPTTAHLVLVVEDNDELREFMAGELASRYRVLTAANGQEGWQICLAELPDLVISDVMMPLVDGFTLVERIKTTPLTSHIAVILLTAKTMSDSRIQGLTVGANEYLTKPFNVQELTLRITNLLAHQQQLRQHWQEQMGQLAGPITPVAVSKIDDPFLVKLYQVLNRELANSAFGVEDLADELAVSPRTLHRKLSTLTGKTAIELMRVYRLQQAARFLQEGCSISEAGEKAGFVGVSYFSKAFKAQFGVSPTTYLLAQNRP